MNMTNTMGLIYEVVNSAETFDQLSQAILKSSDSDGNIRGRTNSFNAYKMANNCIDIGKSEYPNFNKLTREFGIRQQAIYLKHYEKSSYIPRQRASDYIDEFDS